MKGKPTMFQSTRLFSFGGSLQHTFPNSTIFWNHNCSCPNWFCLPDVPWCISSHGRDSDVCGSSQSSPCATLDWVLRNASVSEPLWLVTDSSLQIDEITLVSAHEAVFTLNENLCLFGRVPQREVQF